ncbi:tryptophan synthase beta subunit-like PLP-dependent enzyme [Thermoascus aurantiacus ATCC 26904]
MALHNPLNVYTGPNSVVDYHNPECQPPLPLVEIPERLNPFRKDGVRIYAKMMTMLPIHNVKSLPALNLLQKGNGVDEKTKTVVEYSSGSTIISMAVLAKVLHGIDDTRAYMSNKTSMAKIQLMRLFGLEVTLFGGPSQPEPTDPRGGIQKAKTLAEENDGVVNPNQYENPANPDAHFRWTGPQILRQLPHINIFCTGMGTSGSMTGTGRYLKSQKPSIFCVGVCTAPGDRVPGPRSYALLAPVEFPWREAVDTVEEVTSFDAFRLSLDLIREGILCGPSSGFNLKGLFQFLEKRKAAGTLRDLAGEDSEIHCVFLCCDLPYQYVQEYFDKLGETYFRPIINENLIGVDSHRYDEAWEIPPEDALSKLYASPKGSDVETYQDYVKSAASESSPNGNGVLESVDLRGARLKQDMVLLDLRTERSYNDWHLPGSTHFPISSLKEDTVSPFSDSSVLRAQWLELENIFKKREADKDHDSKQVVLVDYDGDTARVATSILRAKGVEAWSMRGGLKQLRTTPCKKV